MDMDLGPLEPEWWHSSSVEIFCWREGFCAPKQQGCEAKQSPQGSGLPASFPCSHPFSHLIQRLSFFFSNLIIP
uniref:Uncharacterized protein n=1 Tax=Triticum urartu TaxID=4572 RepID=A0A8R7QRN6_TRIUA